MYVKTHVSHAVHFLFVGTQSMVFRTFRLHGHCIVAPKEYGLMKLGSFLYDLTDALKAQVDIVCEETIQEGSLFKEEMLRDRKIMFEA